MTEDVGGPARYPLVRRGFQNDKALSLSETTTLRLEPIDTTEMPEVVPVRMTVPLSERAEMVVEPVTVAADELGTTTSIDWPFRA